MDMERTWITGKYIQKCLSGLKMQMESYYIISLLKYVMASCAIKKIVGENTHTYLQNLVWSSPCLHLKLYLIALCLLLQLNWPFLIPPASQALSCLSFFIRVASHAMKFFTTSSVWQTPTCLSSLILKYNFFCHSGHWSVILSLQTELGNCSWIVLFHGFFHHLTHILTH